jgi:hypothetical protein
MKHLRQNDVHCIFQLLHGSVREKNIQSEVTEGEILVQDINILCFNFVTSEYISYILRGNFTRTDLMIIHVC